ncbi:beta-propeller domain-containing protein [Pseudalkalibacillus berkeleyi]|uniref:Beta-propeller domain-containing protein n=1 Tax=Pseudalkalibacillus berkeleyi TaxID=1069813 RepID=A0ABS9GZZ8_9BACL|nr:beta-propeller domain-containing protein [Pseudalkalibacillus berkeleyi]MCF6137401.1 beta-propeller domain-containing protein [Pseudalkalibacillus berkeleyi]
MKKWWMLCGLILMIAVFSIGSLKHQFQVVNNWAKAEEVVLQNKSWEVHFSKPVNENHLSDHIYVTNAEGEKQHVTVTINEDKRSILVHPPKEGYSLNTEYYTLHISNSLQAADGQILAQNRRHKFVVQETLPVIGTEENLTQYFERAMSQQKNITKATKVDLQDSSQPAMESASKSQDSIGSFSKTNTQVKGVDEADIVKNDGQYIYQIHNKNIVITKAVPADRMNVVSKISLRENGFTPTQLFLSADKLVVIGYAIQPSLHNHSSKQREMDTLIRPNHHFVHVKVINVHDRTTPIIEREMEIEGSYISARRINQKIYLISQYHPQHFPMLKIKVPNQELRPHIKDSAVTNEKNVIDYSDIQYFPGSNETNFLTVTVIDIHDKNEPAKNSTLLGGGNQIYMTNSNLYIAVHSYPKVTETRTREIAGPSTLIYKFSINDDTIKFIGSTEVEGSIINQFSMDEHDGNFRIATTTRFSRNGRGPSANHLFIFNDSLKLIGSVKGLAEGERIYSARFMGDRIYIVTFKEIDPLFVIDASNPRNPVVKGELKIPGFSNYLHPYDENHLIGFGQHTELIDNKHGEPFVQTNGIKISMFDVTDMENPKEKFTEIIEGRGTFSPLNYDHKALLFNKNKNLFAFPVQIYQSNNYGTNEFEFQGALVYNLSLERGFHLKRKISHSTKDQDYRSYTDDEIRRLVYINDTLYTVSNHKITAHEMGSYQKISEIKIH